MNASLLPVFIVFVVIGIPVICGTLIALAKILKSSSGSSSKSGWSDEDSRVLHELNRSLSRMEERIEALETIIIDRERSPKG